MLVIRRYMHNSLRNYNYLLGCEVTRQAIVIDPYDAELMHATAAEHGFDIKLIINTHEHLDHTQGNLALHALTGAPIYAHTNAQVPGQTHGVQPNDQIELGSLKLSALFTPGHTPVHLCLLAESASEYFLFSGDTLFNACAGNCTRGGNVDAMYESFAHELSQLPAETWLYPGHDYMKNNLAFALNREPSNTMAAYWADQVQAMNAEDIPIMTLGQEREYNPFLRLAEPAIRTQLLTEFPAMEATDRAIFKALRSLRDHW